MPEGKTSKKKPPKKAVTIKEKKTRAGDPKAAEALKILTRQTWALDLKRQGMNYRQIARRLKELNVATPGYDSGLAYKDVKDSLSRLMVEQKELAVENIYLDLQRLDEMLGRVYLLAVPPEETQMPPDIQAYGAVLTILDKREKLLNYKSLWDKPEQPNFNINIDWSAFATEEIIEIRRRIGAGEEPVVVLTEIQQRKQAPKTGT